MHEHTHELARIHTRVCVRVMHARMHARTQALTHRTRTQVRAHHTHANHGLALAHAQAFRVVTTAALLKSQASQAILGNETVAKVTAARL